MGWVSAGCSLAGSGANTGQLFAGHLFVGVFCLMERCMVCVRLCLPPAGLQRHAWKENAEQQGYKTMRVLPDGSVTSANVPSHHQLSRETFHLPSGFAAYEEQNRLSGCGHQRVSSLKKLDTEQGGLSLHPQFVLFDVADDLCCVVLFAHV